MTPEEARAIYHAGEAAVVHALCQLHEEVAVLREQLKELERKVAQLSKDSSNSHKPPSSDDLTKPKPEKGPAGSRPRGGQQGHPKHERALFAPEAVDRHHHHGLGSCPKCDSEAIMLLDREPRILQQMELRSVNVIKEEHRAYAFYCTECDEVHYAPFPAEVIQEGLFKERLTALVAYMKNVNHASFSTIRKFIRDVLGEPVSRGYLRKLIQKVTAALNKPYEELLSRLPLETQLNVDETGHKENGRLFWTWVFKAELYVLFRIDKSRGSEVLIEVLGKEFEGVLGCDYFSAYRKYMKDFNVCVQFCLAHLIRDIKYLIKLPDAPTRVYGERLLQTVKALFGVIHTRAQRTEGGFRRALEAAKQAILKVALEEAPSELDEKGKEQKREAQNIANRFRLHGEAYFQFITTPRIGPTNNLAEQAIRFVVIDRHVTQGTRSEKGRKSNERLWTVVATCAVQGRSAFEFLCTALHAYWYDEPAPSLLPGAT